MAIADFGFGVQAALRQRMEDELQRQAFAHRQAIAEQEMGLRERNREQDASQFRERMDFEREQANRPAPEPAPISLGGRLISRTGQVLYEPPAEPEKPQVLSPGSVLVQGGRIVTRNPAAGPKPERSMDDVLAEYEAKKKIDAQYGGTRPSIGAEKNALNYFNRMIEAERNARAVEDQTGNWDAALSGGIPLLPEFAENFLKTDAGQKYTQAQRMFTEARLRKESGAAIPQSEFENDRRINFRNVGDKPDTMTQKRRSRLETMRGIGNSAGRALQEHYGNDATLDSILQEFAAQEAAAPKPIRQRNARTGQVRISMDGGQTWQIQQ